jgi:hypothetical protein
MITDPTHPLFGQTLPVLALSTHRSKTHVTVLLPTGRRRSVPRQATDLDHPAEAEVTLRVLSPVSVRTILPLARFVRLLQRAKEESYAPSSIQNVSVFQPETQANDTNDRVAAVSSHRPTTTGKGARRVDSTGLPNCSKRGDSV